MILLILALFFIGVQGDVYMAMQPNNLAAGQVPAYAVVQFSVDSLAAFWGAANDFVAVTYLPSLVRCEIPQCQQALQVGNADTWTLWNKFVPVATAAGVNSVLPAIVTDAGGVLTPTLSADANTLTMTAAAALTNRDVLVQVFIPYVYLSANPEFPGVTIVTGLSGQTGAATWYSTASPLVVSTPYTITVPETELSQLRFISLVPANSADVAAPNTITASKLTGLTVTFQPGVQLGYNGVITLEIHGGSSFLANPTVASTISVGPNCGTSPLSLYCCSASTVVVSLAPALVGGLTGALPGWSALQITLAPAGCVIPADKQISFDVPAAYLGTNPPLSIAGGITLGGATPVINWRAVDARIATCAEPQAQLLGRYSSSAPMGNLLFGAGAYQIAGPVADAVVRYTFGPSPYVVGLTRPLTFTASPSTTLTNAIPSVAFSLKVNTAISFSLGVAADSVPAIIVTANQGVFRPNMGTGGNPNPLTGFTPAACLATYFTDSWGTLFILPGGRTNPAVGTQCVIGAGSTLTWTIPALAMLPNLATGSTVTFDVRVLGSFAAAGTVITAAPDTASLMNQLGWTTTASCGTLSAPVYTPGAVDDVASLTYNDRCGLVNGISAISPVTAGIMQCPVGATTSSATNMVTFVKIPEGLWSTNIWPLTNYAALGAWAQSVALTGTPAVAITSWGHMFSTPMYAVVVSYPPVASSLTSLNIVPNVASTYQLAFIVKMNRLTMYCSSADTLNAWQFQVSTCNPVALVNLYTRTNMAGTALNSVTGSTWGLANCVVLATVTQGGTVAGWYPTTGSPTADSGSDDALFGLLALIAIPLLLCCCLLWALWYFLRRQPELPCPCPAEYPMQQEMYWVNPQPVAAAYPQAVPMTAPPTTPLYLVQ